MRRLAIIRPEPGASESADRARQLGLTPLVVPLFELEPLQWTAPDPAGFDALLLTSANSVRLAGKQLQQLRGLPVLAVGEATAEAARTAGLGVRQAGGGGVDSLLESIPPGRRLLHLCGEQRREPNDESHAITALPVYRSADRDPSEDLAAIEGSVVAVHSPRAARRLGRLATEHSLDQSAISLAAISREAAEAAGSGWGGVETAERPSDEALLALAARLCQT